jgi:Domain of unknown function (DUF4157)/Bacterial protein of unknown function (DUF922)
VMAMPEPTGSPLIQQKESAEQPEGEEEPEEIQAKPLVDSITPLIQRQPEDQREELQTATPLQRETLPEADLQAKCEACGQEEQVQRVLRKASLTPNGTIQAQPDLESRLNNSKGGGSPLADEVRSFMEPRFGADFSGVRVHSDRTSVQMNQELGAQAFTHKQDIYFGAGKSPGKNDLTAHELTHVVQQTGDTKLQASLIQRQGKGSNAQPKAQTSFKVENKTYTITAKTLQEAADQISQREEAGETTWNPKFTLKTDESGNVTDATVDVPITVTMPSWPGAAKLSKAAKAEWDRAFKVLKNHEERHVQLARILYAAKRFTFLND